MSINVGKTDTSRRKIKKFETGKSQMPEASAARSAGILRCNTRGGRTSKNDFPKKVKPCYVCENSSHHAKNFDREQIRNLTAEWQETEAEVMKADFENEVLEAIWEIVFSRVACKPSTNASRVIEKAHNAFCSFHYRTICAQP